MVYFPKAVGLPPFWIVAALGAGEQLAGSKFSCPDHGSAIGTRGAFNATAAVGPFISIVPAVST